MTKEQQADLLIQCGIAKLFSDNSTHLLGELKNEQKHWFNISVNAMDNLLKSIESKLSSHNLETLNLLNEAMCDGVVNLKKELLK